MFLGNGLLVSQELGFN
jgi:hypothetical protein